MYTHCPRSVPHLGTMIFVLNHAPFKPKLSGIHHAPAHPMKKQIKVHAIPTSARDTQASLPASICARIGFLLSCSAR